MDAAARKRRLSARSVASAFKSTRRIQMCQSCSRASFSCASAHEELVWAECSGVGVRRSTAAGPARSCSKRNELINSTTGARLQCVTLQRSRQTLQVHRLACSTAETKALRAKQNALEASSVRPGPSFHQVLTAYEKSVCALQSEYVRFGALCPKSCVAAAGPVLRGQASCAQATSCLVVCFTPFPISRGFEASIMSRNSGEQHL